jgi:hypothetical protein
MEQRWIGGSIPRKREGQRRLNIRAETLSCARMSCGDESSRLQGLCQEAIERSVGVISLQGHGLPQADTQGAPASVRSATL